MNIYKTMHNHTQPHSNKRLTMLCLFTTCLLSSSQVIGCNIYQYAIVQGEANQDTPAKQDVLNACNQIATKQCSCNFNISTDPVCRPYEPNPLVKRMITNGRLNRASSKFWECRCQCRKI